MAIWTTCLSCRKEFSAQEDYLGKKVRCPSCGARVEVLDAGAREAADRKQLEDRRWQDEQAKRIELFENRARQERRSLAGEFGVSNDRVRNFHPGAVSRFRKLRALSRFMLLGAYLFLPLVLAGGAITVHLWRESGAGDPALLGLLLLGWLLLLCFSFFLFKFLGEMSWLLADLGDHQLDVRNLLLDLRDDMDRAIAPERR